MADRLVCNINFYIYSRFIFGFYHKFRASERVRWLARIYCCLVCVIIIIFFWQLLILLYPFSLAYIATIIEHSFYLFIAFRNNNKFLIRFYKVPIRDYVTKDTYKLMHRYIVSFIVVLALLKCINLCCYLNHVWFTSVFVFVETLVWFSIMLGRLPAVFVFILLYTRVWSMRKMMETKEFEFRSHGVHHPQRYIQIYEAIMDSFDNCNDPMKIQLFAYIVLSTIFNLLGTAYILYSMRNYGNVSLDIIVSFFFDVFLGYSPLVISAVLSDMVISEMQGILAIVLERRNACNNERHRAEIQKLYLAVGSNPFEYRLWHVVPLNLRSLLSFLSFSVTTIIALLQIHAMS